MKIFIEPGLTAADVGAIRADSPQRAFCPVCHDGALMARIENASAVIKPGSSKGDIQMDIDKIQDDWTSLEWEAYRIALREIADELKDEISEERYALMIAANDDMLRAILILRKAEAISEETAHC